MGDPIDWHIIDRTTPSSIDYVKTAKYWVRNDIGFLPMPDGSQCLVYATKSGRLIYRRDALRATQNSMEDFSWIRTLLTKEQVTELNKIAKRIVEMVKDVPEMDMYLVKDKE